LDVAMDSVRAFRTVVIVPRVPNRRLKLTAPLVCGGIAFVNVLVRRPSLSTLR